MEKDINRKAMLEHSASGTTFAGQLSFLRRKYTRSIAGADVGIAGVPFEPVLHFYVQYITIEVFESKIFYILSEHRCANSL